MRTIFKLFNKLYDRNFFIYKHLYKLYKIISDKSEIKLIKSFVKPGMTVIDIGANIGFYTELLSDLVGESGRVYAFEPHPGNFEKLNNSLKNRKNIFFINKAVGNSNEKIKLFISKDLNVEHKTFQTEVNEEYIEVDCVRLDDYLGNESSINFIKIDIQGYEYEALKGMKKICLKNSGLKIISEFYPDGFKMTGSNPEEYLNFLHEMKFTIKIISKLSKLEHLDVTDMVKINKIEVCNILCEK